MKLKHSNEINCSETNICNIDSFKSVSNDIIQLNLFEQNSKKNNILKLDRKANFLNEIQSPNERLKYKRYLGSPLRYAGGKSLAVGHIIEHIPSNISRLVSPFIGGASLEIACSKELEIDVFGYDIFDILVNYWQCQISHPQELYQNLAQITPTSENYNNVKQKLKQHWLKTSNLNNIDLATYYFFNHNLSYGPGFLGWMSSIYQDSKKYNTAINKVRDFKPLNLAIECLTFEKSIAKHQGDFIYCDPPYFLDGDSKMFKGIYPQRNFPVHHKGFNHHHLAELLNKHKGGFLLSYNDCSEIRNLYSKFRIIEIEWQYTMGQGETRIGKNRLAKEMNHVKKSHEILIIGY